MAVKIKELLAVLDLPEEEQYEWVDNNCELEGWVAPISKDFVPTESLADLAFRMRDEWKRNIPETPFYRAMLDVQNYTQKDSVRAMDYEFWAFAKPIPWIIAAFIAKSSAAG